MGDKSERKYSFDALKLIAIAIIVLHHYQQLSQIRFSEGINWFGGEFYWGYLVELFFIISGYFAYHSIDAITGCSSVRFSAFILRKYYRFLPMLIICGLACLAAEWSYGRMDSDHIFPYTFWNVISSLLGFERWFDEAMMVNNPMWYVSVLLLCFVLLFFVTSIARKANLSLFLVYGIMVSAGLIMRAVCLEYDVSIPLFNASIGRGILCFFLGLLIALVLNRPAIAAVVTKSKIVFLVAGFIVASFIVLFALKPHSIGDTNALYYSLCFIIYPALMVMCENSIMRAVFKASAFKHVGGIAYNMYTWHITLIYTWLIVFRVLGLSLNVVVMYAFLALCFLFAVASYTFIDKPLSRYVSIKKKTER